MNSHHKVIAYDALKEAVGSSMALKYAESARIVRNLSPFSEDFLDKDGVPG